MKDLQGQRLSLPLTGHVFEVPERLAIAGFGVFEVAAASPPQITTVAVDCFGIGRTSGELLLLAIEAARTGQALAPQTILIPYRVEARGST